KVLAINPGSTSTKFALYADERPVLVKNLRHADEELAQFRGGPILEQQGFCAQQIAAALRGSGEGSDPRFSPRNGEKHEVPCRNSVLKAGALSFPPSLGGKGGTDSFVLDAVVARGGLLPPLSSGTYEVNDDMLEELRAARRGEHASNLGAFLAHSIAQKA